MNSNSDIAGVVLDLLEKVERKRDMLAQEMAVEVHGIVASLGYLLEMKKVISSDVNDLFVVSFSRLCLNHFWILFSHVAVASTLVLSHHQRTLASHYHQAKEI